jgi:hypothetical protein
MIRSTNGQIRGQNEARSPIVYPMSSRKSLTRIFGGHSHQCDSIYHRTGCKLFPFKCLIVGSLLLVRAKHQSSICCTTSDNDSHNPPLLSEHGNDPGRFSGLTAIAPPTA